MKMLFVNKETEMFSLRKEIFPKNFLPRWDFLITQVQNDIQEFDSREKQILISIVETMLNIDYFVYL